MDALMARTIVEALANGINPVTGCMLFPTDACADEWVQEALAEVLKCCSIESNEQLLKRLKEERRQKGKQTAQDNKTRYNNQGKPWTEEETIRLRQLNAHKNIWQTSKILGRSPGAIRSKLINLGIQPNKRGGERKW